MRLARRAVTATVAVVCTTLVASCGLQSGSAVPLAVEPGSIQPVPALEGVSLTVGSKDFTEQLILGYMIEYALSAAGADVRDLTNIQGSNSTHQAMLNGQVDITFEYTGTGWINYLKNEKPIPDATKQFEAVRDADAKNGLVWVNPAPMDNTYALAMSRKVAEETGVKTLSDYAELVKKDPALAQTCLETEFVSRQDGFPGMAATYGFDPAVVPVKTLQTGLIYASTATGGCRFGEVFTTDGRILGLDLQLVEDDKQFFPRYNATVVIRQEVAEKYPEIATVLEPISKILTNEEITKLNAKVDVDGEDPAEVARQWMVDKGFVTL
ncbi:glycine betaine ABC transporter substrate-binding protein [Rhodococcus sp. X156]|uniref:glycine betaine ABC transporter substrate-binding protein n=1 Tax=Rhodococcus sp. X156 TaxID=2499145 RepID=UPI000FDBF99F|nr:glycine betaine ABC transporter substrate-binding protein [Rhodococcus sp. X156]